MKKTVKKEKSLRTLKRELRMWENGTTERYDAHSSCRAERTELSNQIKELEDECEQLKHLNRESEADKTFLRGRLEGIREALGWKEATPEAGFKDRYYGEDTYKMVENPENSLR